MSHLAAALAMPGGLGGLTEETTVDAMSQIAEMPAWLVELIEEKAKDPANFDKDGRLCIAPGIHIRWWLTDDEARLLCEPTEGDA
jgi:hypothetical protein